jgi:hypothetical protein
VLAAKAESVRTAVRTAERPVGRKAAVGAIQASKHSDDSDGINDRTLMLVEVRGLPAAMR